MSSSVDREFKKMMDRKYTVLRETHNLILQFNSIRTLYNDHYSRLRKDYPECCADLNMKINNFNTSYERLAREYNIIIKPGKIVQTHIHTMNVMKQNIKTILTDGFKLDDLIFKRHEKLKNVSPSDIPNTIKELNSSSRFASIFD